MNGRTVILGISAFYHDSAAALLVDGELVAAAQEERFSRIKHDATFPIQAIRYVLAEAGLTIKELNKVIFYEKPFLKFERLLETYHAFAPSGFPGFRRAMPLWIKEKLFMKRNLKGWMQQIGDFDCPIAFSQHHLSHAASAFYPSPFKESAILVADGVGEWTTLSLARGSHEGIEILSEQRFPHSLGLLYSSLTFYAGFRVNSGEYKLMGLAPYADPKDPAVKKLVDQIKTHLIDIREDGSFLLNMRFFKFATGLQMTHDSKWEKIFGFARREFDSEMTKESMQLAMASQLVLEEVMLKLVDTLRKLTGSENLCMAGGVALNCVCNSSILKSKTFKNIWVQPASGDAGGALGAALAAWHLSTTQNTAFHKSSNYKHTTFLGPSYSDLQCQIAIKKFTSHYAFYPDFGLLCQKVGGWLREGKVVGWFQGRMEFGPRALGNRSILADPTFSDMQRKVNIMVKKREGFRPFAPCVLEEDACDYFDCPMPSPFMLFTYSLLEKYRNPIKPLSNLDKLLEGGFDSHSCFPAITHVDDSSRVQTVSSRENPKLHALLKTYKGISGHGLLLNTSFNQRGEPIVCSPEDALRCFFSTGLDALVLGSYVIEADRNPQDNILKNNFPLD